LRNVKKLQISSPIEVKAEATVNPSEDPDRIINAITKIIDGCLPEFRYGSRIIGRVTGSESLGLLYEQVRSRSAMGVLRRMLLDNRTRNSTWFLLNKQAATAGIAAIIEEEQESALGPIRVTISCEELDNIIEWIVPET
jgi:predicted RNA binding protein with dsRBD fold (UPF0201 family)